MVNRGGPAAGAGEWLRGRQVYTSAMPSMPVLGHLLLAFALLANALGLQAMGHAHSTMAPVAEASMAAVVRDAPKDHGDCHGQAAGDDAAPAPVDGQGPLPGDCCDGPGCACDCLHQAPLDVRAVDIRGIARFATILRGHPRVLASSVFDTPRLRPPIA
jgi:hypothetical protein